MFSVKDKAGKQFLVAMYLDNDVTLPEIWQKYSKPGNVMAIMYADQHHFMDGQIGIRVEEMETVKVRSVILSYFVMAYLRIVQMLPCSLNTLLDMSDELNSPSMTCQHCTKAASLKCSSCSMFYCAKVCCISFNSKS